MKLVESMKKTPLWLLLPTVVLAAITALALAGYEPLVFDGSLYEIPTANADEIRSIDAAAIEGQQDPVEAADSLASIGSAQGLSDGSWTGYAPCGIGNSDGWKPYYVQVAITVAGGAVAGVDTIGGSSTGNSGDAPLSWDAAENQLYLDKAAEGPAGVRAQIESALAANTQLASVDTVSGATYSSISIYNAYADAIAKAGATGVAAGGQAAQGTATKKASTGAKKSLAVEEEASGSLADGTWQGFMACGLDNPDDWQPYYVEVDVRVKDGAVTDITQIKGTSTGEKGQKKLAWDAAENQVYLDWAISGRTLRGMAYPGVQTQIEAALAQKKQPASIDAVSGATYSSEAILGAYSKAVAKAAAAGGSTDEQPVQPIVKPSDDPAVVPSQPIPVPGIEDTGDMELIDGTYEGYALCRDEDAPSVYGPYYIFVEIQVENGKIARISKVYGDEAGKVDERYVYDAHENASYLNKAIKGAGLFTKGVQTQIQAKLDAGNPVENIDTVSGATWSSLSIIEAYGNAVKAAIEAAQAQDQPNPEEPAIPEEVPGPETPEAPGEDALATA